MCLHISDDEDKPGIITLFFSFDSEETEQYSFKEKSSEVQTVKKVKSTNIDKAVNSSSQLG